MIPPKNSFAALVQEDFDWPGKRPVLRCLSIKFLLTYYGRPDQPPPPQAEMTHEQEMEFWRIRRRSARARDALVRRYLCWAFKIASKLKGPRLEFNEAVSAANAGLMEAIEGYDAQSGYAFTTYSAIIIRRHVINALIATYPVKVSDHLRKKLAKQAKLEPAVLERQLKPDEPRSLAELFEKLAEVPDFDVAELFIRQEDAPFMPAEAENPAEACEEESLTAELKAALDTLLPLQRAAVLRHHYRGQTFEEIARALGKAKSSVREAHDVGMLRLRRHLEGKR